MLKERIITGIILVTCFLLLVFCVPPVLFSIIVGLITLLAAWEWSKLIGIHNKYYSAFYILLIICGMSASWATKTQFILSISVGWWLCALVWLTALKRLTFQIHPIARISMLSLLGLVVLIPCWLSVSVIRMAKDGPVLLLLIVAIICFADIGAYFVGRWKGKHLLAPLVSPKKTWEGLLGGLISGLVVALVGGILLHIAPVKWPKFLLAVLLTVLFSVIGDLFESLIKRQAGVKDSGNYLPGHGGILDRIDSLTAGIPVFLWLIIVLNLF